MPAASCLWRKNKLRPFDRTRDSDERGRGIWQLGKRAVRIAEVAQLVEEGLGRFEPWLVGLAAGNPAWGATGRVAEVVGGYDAA